MARAIQLARKGQYSTTPNPNVGCVIVDQAENIIGEGYHKVAGQAHAEINALNQAASNAEGSTVFVTLEPCAHQGKTGPCADALVKAKVKRVVIANADPNPLVAGKGCEILRRAGIEVEQDLMSEEAGKLNAGFFKRMKYGLPYVTMKLAASMDGKTALANGQSQWITSAQSRLDVHIERAKQCAILTGSGTVLHDNPSMTVRLSESNSAVADAYGQRENPLLRVVIDGKNQLHQELNLFDELAPSLVLNIAHNKAFASNQEQWQVATKGEYIDLASALRRLAKEKQINHLWVEAGSRLCGSLIQASLVDKIILYQAPMLLGDKGRSLLEMTEITDLQNAVSMPISTINRIGPDIKIELELD